MIDLHSHTTNSDGTWTTKELLTKAEELGLEIFSITDHDTAKSYIEIEKIFYPNFSGLVNKSFVVHVSSEFVVCECKRIIN